MHSMQLWNTKDPDLRTQYSLGGVCGQSSNDNLKLSNRSMFDVASLSRLHSSATAVLSDVISFVNLLMVNGYFPLSYPVCSVIAYSSVLC
jgi:hypothetical protein